MFWIAKTLSYSMMFLRPKAYASLSLKRGILIVKIQMISGGLGNQIQQYVFARFIERHFPEEKFFYDDSRFFARQFLNGYELERVFGLKLNLLSKHLRDGVWSEVIRARKEDVFLPKILMDMGIQTVVIREPKLMNKPIFTGEIVNSFGFSPKIAELPYKNIYYLGVWRDQRWFLQYKEENLNELRFPEIIGKQNLEYEHEIQNSMSIGIHIRRGDFLSVGWVVPDECYKNACKSILEKRPEAHFFIFSNDLEWCKANADNLGFALTERVTYVSGNIGKMAYIDMQLLSLCKGIIRPAQSTFSQVAAWLDDNLEFEITLGEYYN